MELFNSNTYSFADLSKKYDDFMRPAYKIKVGGKDMVNTLGFISTSVSVSQTLGCKSGCFKFNVQNAYDLKSGKFKSEFHDAFKLGTEIEGALGYGSSLPVIFKGFIGDVSFNFSESSSPAVTITCFDIRTLMLQGYFGAMPPESSFDVIMEKLLKDYSSIVTMKLSYDDSWNKEEEFKQNESNFKYIYNYAKKRGYEFFVLGEYIYFIKSGNNKAPVTTLKWGDSILSFSRNYSYSPIKVLGTLPALLGVEPFSDSAVSESNYPSEDVANKKIEKYIDTSDAKNAEDLKRIVECYSEKIKSDSMGGTIKCIGLPEIVPGRFVQLENLDSDLFDKKYYITSVEHNFSSSGYITSFNISGEN